MRSLRQERTWMFQNPCCKALHYNKNNIRFRSSHMGLMSGTILGALPSLSVIQYCKAVLSHSTDEKTKAEQLPSHCQEVGKGGAWPGTRVPLATQNWFCPVLSWDSADLSHGAARGAWQHVPHPHPENHSLGVQGQLKEPLK